jgi:hypothetical protein
LPELSYSKAVIRIFKERLENPELDPFVVSRAKKLIVIQEGAQIDGIIQDFFTLMGDADYLTSKEGIDDRYVMCWFDDSEPDMNKDLRLLTGVTFNGHVSCVVGENGKRTYNATFKATYGRLK